MRTTWSLAALAMAAFIAGCGSSHPGQTCSGDADCSPSDHCVSGLCVIRASASIGSTSGSGTSGSQGSSSSGSTGGASCVIGGQSFADGAPNPANACEVCRSANPSAWTPLEDGQSCGTGMVCSGDSCQSGCFVGGTLLASGAANPNNPCQVCDPVMSTSAFSAVTDGTSCGSGLVCKSGQCGTGCEIDGGTVPSGEVDPADACAICQPASSTTDWSTLADGTDCATAQICASGMCGLGCFIANAIYSPDAGNPANACEACAPHAATHAWTNRPDGVACASDEVCYGGACTNGCWVNGAFYVPDAGSPTDACQGCYPDQATGTFSARPDGLDCDAGSVCDQGSCQAGCFIGGGFEAPATTEPGNPCASCQPAASTHGWSPDGDGANPSCASGTVCHTGSCTAGCFISNAFVAPDAGEPANSCQVCSPAASTTAWTAGHEGATDTCASGQVCHSGSCAAGCFINGTFVAPGAANPSNPCETCNPASSTSSYTAMSDGSVCNQDNQHFCRSDACIFGCNVPGYGVVDAGAFKDTNTCESCQPAATTTDFSPVTNGTACSVSGGTVCFNGACDPGCFISGTYQANGADNGTNSCQTCQDGVSTSSWTNAQNGTSCNVNGGDVCYNGGSGSTCQNGCYIGTSFYASGTVNPANPCQICTPSSSKTAWTTRSEGTSCGTGKVCNGTSCTAGCYIASTFYADGTVNPGNACQVCSASSSTTSWTTRAEGTSCGSGLVCNGTSCSSGCYIGSTYYSANTLNGSNDCQSCQPSKSTTAWSNLSSGVACDSSQGFCNGSGSCALCASCGSTAHCCSPKTCNVSYVGSPPQQVNICQ